MNYTGNTEYKQIQNKQYITVDTDKSAEIIAQLSNRDIQYSARYDDKKLTVTFNNNDFEAVNNIINRAKTEAPEALAAPVITAELQKENPLKNAEEQIEGNYNQIDGIINNEPPKKEELKPTERAETRVFTFSRKQLNDNARAIKEQPSEHRHRDKEPPSHDSL